MKNLPEHLNQVPDEGSVVGVGVSSGTSCDGIDVAIVKFSWNNLDYKVEESGFICYEYPEAIREQLLKVSAGEPVSASDLANLEHQLSNCFADAVAQMIQKYPTVPDYVVTHGQTVAHLGNLGTMQLGNPATIANRTGLWTVGNLRLADVSAGGQGAPILPICDQLLRSGPSPVIILNLGGVANATLLTSSGVEAFDIGPANALLDGIWQQNNQSRYDAGGTVGTSGSINPGDVQSLLVLIEAAVDGSSLHKDAVGAQLLSLWKPERSDLADMLAAATEATALHISVILNEKDADKIYVSGGGWHNKLLISRLSAHLQMPLFSIDDLHESKVTVDSREAVDFALLGHLWFRGIPAGLRAVTGAKFDTIAGALWPPVQG
ncbi:hypothetical protein HN388_02180 [bacterium]|jgi:anhydro-N-acetylmuramic acid kinase|nr:hypothetical protein [bacterium]MBT4292868.1 hypothetical protein [bacterium]MBT7310686.1 hypothetical protein [bacterium]